MTVTPASNDSVKIQIEVEGQCTSFRIEIIDIPDIVVECPLSDGEVLVANLDSDTRYVVNVTTIANYSDLMEESGVESGSSYTCKYCIQVLGTSYTGLESVPSVFA